MSSRWVYNPPKGSMIKATSRGMGNSDAPGRSKCEHCDRAMNNFAGGSSKGPGNTRLCHPNVRGRPDCYRLVTIYKHPIPCDSPTCYEDHDDLLIYVDARNNKEGPPF